MLHCELVRIKPEWRRHHSSRHRGNLFVCLCLVLPAVLLKKIFLFFFRSSFFFLHFFLSCMNFKLTLTYRNSINDEWSPHFVIYTLRLSLIIISHFISSFLILLYLLFLLLLPSFFFILHIIIIIIIILLIFLNIIYENNKFNHIKKKKEKKRNAKLERKTYRTFRTPYQPMDSRESSSSLT